MDIAYTVRRSFPGPGGIATMMRVVATQLATRHRVRVWAARIDGTPFTRTNTTLGAQVFHPAWIEGVEVRPVPMGLTASLASTPMSLLTVPGLRRFAYRPLRSATAVAYAAPVAAALARDWGSPDLVHAWGGEHINWAAGRAARRDGRPLVVTPFAHPGAWGDDPMNVRFYKEADAVLALVPSEAAFYSSLGVDAGRVRVVGVPATPLPPPGDDVRAMRGIGDHPLVLFVGAKEPYKGYRTLLEAARMVWADLPETRFAFVGPRTADSVADFEGEDDPRVIEVDAVPADELAAWHEAATVLCLPSTSEIMPVVILEAWRAGTPVVVAEWWCARDIVTNERDGLVVDPDARAVADGLLAVLGDPDGARAMGEAGRSLVADRFSPQAVAARHEAVYEELA